MRLQYTVMYLPTATAVPDLSVAFQVPDSHARSPAMPESVAAAISMVRPAAFAPAMSLTRNSCIAVWLCE